MITRISCTDGDDNQTNESRSAPTELYKTLFDSVVRMRKGQGQDIYYPWGFNL